MVAHRPAPTKGDPQFHTLFLPCTFAGWSSRDVEVIARDTDGPFLELPGRQGLMGPAMVPMLYCDKYGS